MENQIKCPKCGETLEAGMKICPVCEASIAAPTACRQCGKELKPHWGTCPWCKTPVAGTVECNYCGEDLDSTMAVCPNCGRDNPIARAEGVPANAASVGGKIAEDDDEDDYDEDEDEDEDGFDEGESDAYRLSFPIEKIIKRYETRLNRPTMDYFHPKIPHKMLAAVTNSYVHLDHYEYIIYLHFWTEAGDGIHGHCFTNKGVHDRITGFHAYRSMNVVEWKAGGFFSSGGIFADGTLLINFGREPKAEMEILKQITELY